MTDTASEVVQAIEGNTRAIQALHTLVAAIAQVVVPVVEAPPANWSDERRDCLRANWELPISDLTALLNTLPGAELRTKTVCAYALVVLKMPKRATFRAPVPEAAPVPVPAPASRPVAAPPRHMPAAYLPAPAQSAPLPTWTPARLNMLGREYSTRVLAVLQSELNLLPGPLLRSADILARAAALGLNKSAPVLTGPIIADFDTIRMWAGIRGIPFNCNADLPKVNRKAADLGLRPFVIETLLNRR